jgi:hypothetical protein
MNAQMTSLVAPARIAHLRRDADGRLRRPTVQTFARQSRPRETPSRRFVRTALFELRQG